MATRRMIASDIWRDEFIGGLDLTGRLLWIGLITTEADDQGRMVDNPKLIRSDIFPFDDIPTSEIEGQLAGFAIARKVTRYEADGKRLIQIVNWWDYQTPSWASASKYKAPAGWVDREKYHTAGNKIVSSNWDKPGGYSVLPSELHSVLPSGIEEGEVKVNGEGEGKSEESVDDPNDALFELFQHTIESKGIMLNGPDDIAELSKLVTDGITNDDLLEGIKWKAANNGGKAVCYISQIIGPSKVAKAKRLQSGNGQPARELVVGPGGRVSL